VVVLSPGGMSECGLVGLGWRAMDVCGCLGEWEVKGTLGGTDVSVLFA